jgi:hypothetical protein
VTITAWCSLRHAEQIKLHHPGDTAKGDGRFLYAESSSETRVGVKRDAADPEGTEEQEVGTKDQVQWKVIKQEREVQILLNAAAGREHRKARHLPSKVVQR